MVDSQVRMRGGETVSGRVSTLAEMAQLGISG